MPSFLFFDHKLTELLNKNIIGLIYLRPLKGGWEDDKRFEYNP